MSHRLPWQFELLLPGFLILLFLLVVIVLVCQRNVEHQRYQSVSSNNGTNDRSSNGTENGIPLMVPSATSDLVPKDRKLRLRLKESRKKVGEWPVAIYLTVRAKSGKDADRLVVEFCEKLKKKLRRKLVVKSAEAAK